MATRRAKMRSDAPISTDLELSRQASVSSGSAETGAIEKLTEVMTEFMKASTSRGASMTARGEVIPVFDPENREQDIESWCRKVDELREIFKWSEDATIYFAVSKLSGLAEVWYRGLQSVRYNWEEWKDKLKSAFPCTRDFYEMLGEVMRRKKRPEETYSKYFYEMNALLGGCKIVGIEAVSCIIGGITDTVVRTGAKAGNYKTPESLYEYLKSLNDMSQSVHTYFKPSKHFPKKRHHVGKSSRTNTKNEAAYTARQLDKKSVTCFKCKKTGHYSSECRALNEKRCNYCRRRGHYESECFKKKNEAAA